MHETTAGNYNINIALLGRIQIPIPDPRLQRRFSAITARARETVNMTESSIRPSQDLSASLLPCLLETKDSREVQQRAESPANVS